MEETTPTVTTRSTGIRYGLILGVISILFFAIMIVASMDMNGPARWLGIPIDIVLIFLAHKYFKENGDGFMSFGQGFGISVWIGIIASAISSVSTYVYAKFIDSSFIQQMKDQQIEQMQERGMSDQEIDQAMSIAGAFMSAEAILIMGLIMGVIIMCVLGLLVTIFTQKRNPDTAI